MTGYVIAVVTFALAFAFGTIRFVRPRVVLGVGAALALGWTAALAAGTSEVIPLWYVAGLVLLLYGIWCGGLWLGLRFRRIRQATPG